MKTEYQLHIIRKVKLLRETNGYSQSQLATYLDISPGQMGNIESIKYPQKYTLSQLNKICKLFNITIQSLFIEEKNCGIETSELICLLINKIIEYEE